MAPSEITALGLVVVLALVGVYDAWTIILNGYESSVTHVVRNAAREWSVIPFALGALIAHILGW